MSVCLTCIGICDNRIYGVIHRTLRVMSLLILPFRSKSGKTGEITRAMSQNFFKPNRFAKNSNQDRYKMTFDNFDHAYIARQPHKIYDSGFGTTLKQWFRNPLVITVSLFCLGAFAANTLIGFFGAEQTSEESLPLVTADSQPFKTTPVERGGMSVPNHESTVFQTMRSVSLSEQAPVQGPSLQETSNQSLQAFAAEAAQKLEDEKPPVNLLDPPPAAKDTAGAPATDSTEDSIASGSVQDEAENASAEQAAAKIENLLAEIDETPIIASASEAGDDGQPVVKVTNEVIPPNPGVVQTSARSGVQPGQSSPETIEFVRSVLEKKDTRAVLGSQTPSQEAAMRGAGSEREPGFAEIASAPAASVADIEPASGNPVQDVEGATYYVQLSSVTSEAGAQSEWSKLQASFVEYLAGQPHRVARADLGERGVYYRIQAGPYSKEAAVGLCEQIKAQKPGGCLVVQ